MTTYSYPDEVARKWKAELDAALAENALMRSALEKIGNFETLADGDKYVSHEQGWHGVAEFARNALKTPAHSATTAAGGSGDTK